MTRRLIAGGILALLWLVCGLGAYLLQFADGPVATLARAIPSPMRGSFFGLPPGWAIAVHALAVLLIVVAYAVIVSWFAGRRGISFAAGWIAAVLTGFVVGGVLDLGDLVAWVSRLGVRGALGTTGAAALTVFWALVVGWIPALIARSRRAEDAGHGGTARGGTAHGGTTHGGTTHAGTTLIVTTAIAVVTAVALPFAMQGGHAAAQAQLRQDQATSQAEASANADPGGAAARDPKASGAAVPTVAPSGTPAPGDACTPANSTIMAPGSDAATGHRLQSLQLVNTSQTPCTVSGYPDVAFGDQNGHLLPVTLERGPSFMADDPGPTKISLAPGASARAGIGWDANSMQGQLAARTLWAAVSPGAQRLSWDVVLDIVPGATVSVTAWQDEASNAG